MGDEEEEEIEGEVEGADEKGKDGLMRRGRMGVFGRRRRMTMRRSRVMRKRMIKRTAEAMKRRGLVRWTMNRKGEDILWPF